LTFEPELEGWSALARKFIFFIPNKETKQFLNEINGSKINIERQLKEEIENRIMTMRDCRLIEALGKEFAKLIKIYIRAKR
jgi:hypothetical protein